MFGFSSLLQQYLHSSRNPLIQRNLTVTSRLGRKHFTSFEGFLPSVSKINLILKPTFLFRHSFFVQNLCMWKARVRLIAPTSHLFDLLSIPQCSAEPNKGLNYCSSIVEGQETHTHKNTCEENQDNWIPDSSFTAFLIFHFSFSTSSVLYSLSSPIWHSTRIYALYIVLVSKFPRTTTRRQKVSSESHIAWWASF